jgi:uncharacterized protein (UPF0332 family)
MMHPSDLYHLSVKLLNDQREQSCDHQSYARTIVNRAYYAAFLAAREFTGQYSRIGSHEVVIEALKNKPNCAKLGNKLDDMRTCRTAADYDLNKPLNPKCVGTVLRGSEQLLTNLGYMRPSPPLVSDKTLENNTSDS